MADIEEDVEALAIELLVEHRSRLRGTEKGETPWWECQGSTCGFNTPATSDWQQRLAQHSLEQLVEHKLIVTCTDPDKPAGDHCCGLDL